MAKVYKPKKDEKTGETKKVQCQAGVAVGGTAAVYIAAILEYMVAEVLELAGNAAKEMRQKRVGPRHLQLAIRWVGSSLCNHTALAAARGDEELDQLIKATISGGGVIPHIHKSLLPRKEGLVVLAPPAAC
jgi:histone H2A